MTPTRESAVRGTCDLESMRFRAFPEKMRKIVVRWAVMKEHEDGASIIGDLLDMCGGPATLAAKFRNGYAGDRGV